MIGPKISSMSSSLCWASGSNRRRHAVAVLAQPIDRAVEVAEQHAGATAVERMRRVDLGPQPLEAVPLQAQGAEER